MNRRSDGSRHHHGSHLDTSGIQIATLARLWNASRSLARIRGKTGAPDEGPGTPAEPPLWNAYELRILDVRPAQAFSLRHIPEAVSIPASEITSRVYELPPKWRYLIVLSDQPEDAARTVETLCERGWRRAVPLMESVHGWPGPWESGPARRTLWEPTPVVRRWAPCLNRGRVLDLGCGSGRNAVFLAMLGHEVTALDLLPDALAMAEQLAARMGVSITTRQMDLRKERPPAHGGFDTILMIRFLERSLFPWMMDVLRPGGTLILETFTREQCFPGAPRKKARTLRPQEALRVFTAGAASARQTHPTPPSPQGPSRGCPTGAAGGKNGTAPALSALEYLELPDTSGMCVARLVARKEPEGSNADAAHYSR